MLTATTKRKSLRRWEQALLFGVAFSLLLGLWLSHQQAQLANKVIRLHIIANSDSVEDQALKLMVRDRILEEADALIDVDHGISQTGASIQAHLEELNAIAAETVRAAGYSYAVHTVFEETWFPTKSYSGLSLPAGNYTALRVVIGDGVGQNWWCVVFPPLCMNAVTEPVAQTALKGGLSNDEVSLVTGESEGYVIRFKAIELWDELTKAFS